jgi:hypothetical protein
VKKDGSNVEFDVYSFVTTAPYRSITSSSGERLEFELAEGIGSRHKDMPQIQFSSEDI